MSAALFILADTHIERNPCLLHGGHMLYYTSYAHLLLRNNTVCSKSKCWKSLVNQNSVMIIQIRLDFQVHIVPRNLYTDIFTPLNQIFFIYASIKYSSCPCLSLWRVIKCDCIRLQTQIMQEAFLPLFLNGKPSNNNKFDLNTRLVY